MGNLKTNLNKRFWKNKKILITGVTGFKGSWLSLIFYNMGLKITGIGLDPPKNHNLFNLLNLKKK